MSELSQKKIATITLRFENELIDRLQNEAKNHQVSANTLASQAIRRFLDWDIHQPRIGLVNLNKPVFVKIFGRLKKKDVEAMAKIAKDEILDLALFMKGQIDVSSFISWFEMKMLNSSVQISHMTHNGVHTFVMKHVDWEKLVVIQQDNFGDHL